MSANISLAQAASEPSPIPKISNEWRFEVTPYLWGAGIKGTLNFDNVLGDLKSGGMIAAEAHYGNWGVMGDLISATLQNSGSVPIYGGVAKLADKVTLQQTILTGAATYTLANTKEAYVDALLGVRGIDVTATLNGIWMAIFIQNNLQNDLHGRSNNWR